MAKAFVIRGQNSSPLASYFFFFLDFLFLIFRHRLIKRCHGTWMNWNEALAFVDQCWKDQGPWGKGLCAVQMTCRLYQPREIHTTIAHWSRLKITRTLQRVAKMGLHHLGLVYIDIYCWACWLSLQEIKPCHVYAYTKTDDATAELERIVNKKDFFGMDIVGQFNLGFIMTTLAGQLFIIDQHAADEITTFERLCKSHIPQRQPLLLPKKLEISPAEAAILPEYVEALERIGFCIEDGHLCRAPSVAGKKSLAGQFRGGGGGFQTSPFLLVF